MTTSNLITEQQRLVQKTHEVMQQYRAAMQAAEADFNQQKTHADRELNDALAGINESYD